MMNTISRDEGKGYEDISALGEDSLIDAVDAARRLVINMYSGSVAVDNFQPQRLASGDG